MTFDIGSNVCTGGGAGGRTLRHNQIFSDGQFTKICYPWCSAARFARELRHNMLIKVITNTLQKVLCSDDNNTKQIYKKVLHWQNTGIILTRTGLHRLLLNFVSAEFYDTLEMASIC